MGAINILSVTTTNSERPMYISFTGLTWGVGTVYVLLRLPFNNLYKFNIWILTLYSLGPIVGGAFADSSATWRWGFYINLCVGVVVAPVYLLLLPSYDPRPGVKQTQRIRQLDAVGMILETGALVSGIMAISFGGALYAWSSATIIGLFVCSGILWILFAVQQAFAILTTREQRLFPVELIKYWELDILFCQSAVAISCIFITIYFTPVSSYSTLTIASKSQLNTHNSCISNLPTATKLYKQAFAYFPSSSSSSPQMSSMEA